MKSIADFFKSFASSSFKPRPILYVLFCSILILHFASLTSTAYAEPDAAEQSTYASETVPYTFTSGTTAKSSEVNSNFTYLANRSWSLSGSNFYYSGGNVGIGTSTPSRTIHVKGAVTDAILESTASNGSSFLYFGNDQGIVGAIGMGGSSYSYNGGANNLNILVKQGSSNTWTNAIIVQNSSGYVGLSTTSPSYPLHMASGAYVTSGGVWTNASSREYKKDIRALSSEDAMVAFNQLEPVSFKYKTDDEQHVGFIAEDVPDLVASGDRKGLSSMDMVAVLTKVVQEQQKTISALSKKVKSLETKMKKSNTGELK